MKDTAFYTALIRVIENVYSRIAAIALRKRMAGYHKHPHQNTKIYANGIKSPLLNCIDDIIAHQRDDSKTTHDSDSPVLDSATEPKRSASKHTDKPHPINKRNTEELAKHFKAAANESDMYPEIAIKLEHSIWEHIHSSIRCARQGDKVMAAMHTDIANSACEELAHHMSEDQYQSFIVKIDRYLGSLKSG